MAQETPRGDGDVKVRPFADISLERRVALKPDEPPKSVQLTPDIPVGNVKDPDVEKKLSSAPMEMDTSRGGFTYPGGGHLISIDTADDSKPTDIATRIRNWIKNQRQP